MNNGAESSRAESPILNSTWVKIKPPGDRRFWSMFPLTRVPFGAPIFDPQPHQHWSSTQQYQANTKSERNAKDASRPKRTCGHTKPVRPILDQAVPPQRVSNWRSYNISCGTPSFQSRDKTAIYPNGTPSLHWFIVQEGKPKFHLSAS